MKQAASQLLDVPSGAPLGVSGALPPFDFQPLGRVISEPGALARLGEVVQSLGGSRVLLVTDPGLEHAGHPQRAAKRCATLGWPCSRSMA